MKNIYLLLSCIIFCSCSKSYICESNYETPIYLEKSEKSNIVFVVPKNTEVTIIGKSRKFKKIKTDKYEGWTNSPNLNFKSKKDKVNSSNSYKKYNSSSYNKTVNVKGYYRKNGTYVSPHTRSSPKSYKRK
ncbi:SH3 domain-containing protein [Flavobacterium aquicola]|uniref:SH3 domain-containing protein n=1 Tax=Flavobacterium aquicola TaxID=1682742 RepID=A0A3E0DZK4_9FLAO|nr:SH3 domain-containing protein [Flavobacterium aquicola]REG90489.1 hypothetical protein C8P67_12016 [Flavobacterium aquicola]